MEFQQEYKAKIVNMEDFLDAMMKMGNLTGNSCDTINYQSRMD